MSLIKRIMNDGPVTGPWGTPDDWGNILDLDPLAHTVPDLRSTIL